MSEGHSVINLGDLSKPATVLIEKVSAAIGVIWEPHQIRRVARAQADAEMIRALANIQVSEVQDRALRRLVLEEGMRQENMESIAAGAISQLGADAKPEDMDPDWITSFFDKARMVSDAEMQSLWSKLLAGEATKPGSYSKRTIELVASLDKSDAIMFTQLCRFAVVSGYPLPLVFDMNLEIYKSVGLTFVSLTHLESIGLIRFSPSIHFFHLHSLGEYLGMSYFGVPFVMQFAAQQDNNMQLGQVMLTKSGQQLFPICGATPVPEFLPFVLEKFRSFGYRVHTGPSPGVAPPSAHPPVDTAQPPTASPSA